jgi:hypothetical protein
VRNKTLLFLPPAPERIRISGWRGVFTKLEYLILNHRFRSPSFATIAYRLFLLKTSPRQEPWWFPPNERLESLLKWMKF